MGSAYIKDPDAVLDYKFDWAALTNGTGESDWLGSSETISDHTITVAPTNGLTVDSSVLADSDTSVLVWLSSGAAGQSYTVTCQIVTSAARTDDRSITIHVRER